MGFDYYSVEDAPAELQVSTAVEPQDGHLPGHWNTMGHIESSATATSKLYFRWSQSMASIAADILRNAGVDLDAISGRVTDPTRTDPPDLGVMRSLNIGGSSLSMTIVDGKPSITQVPSNLTSEDAAANAKAREAEEQHKAGPKAHKDQCWKCSKVVEDPKRCSRCKQAIYCSKNCQVKDWKKSGQVLPSPGVAVSSPSHKDECQAPHNFSLADAMFRYNEGFWITPSECQKIADALGVREKVQEAIAKLKDTPEKVKQAAEMQTTMTFSSEGDVESTNSSIEGLGQLVFTMMSFGEYCRLAKELGGFYVW